MSYVQIYCEALLDLLDPSSAGNLSIRERPAHAGGGVFVEGLARVPAESAAGQHERATFPTSKAPISAVFHSFWLILGRAIASRNGLEAWMLFPERARAEHSR